MSYNSTQKSYLRRKSIIYVEKSYFEGLKYPINAENVLLEKSPIWMNFPSGTPVEGPHYVKVGVVEEPLEIMERSHLIEGMKSPIWTVI